LSVYLELGRRIMTKIIPPNLKNYILPFDWDVRKVWALPTQVTSQKTLDFEYLLDLPLWSSIKGCGMLFDLSPNEVIQNPLISPYQAERLSAADISFPLDFLLHQGRTWVLDGVHRLAKHKLIGNLVVEVRFHDESSISEIKI
jgi:hypothetical protein